VRPCRLLGSGWCDPPTGRKHGLRLTVMTLDPSTAILKFERSHEGVDMSQAVVHNRHQSARTGARRRPDVVWPRGTVGDARALFRIVGRAARVQTYEVALMASLAATVPLHLAGDRFDAGVSAPAKSHSAPTGRRVLLVHGLGGTKSSSSFLARTLTARGLTVDAITYSPFGTSVKQVRRPARVKVEWLLSQTGADKLLWSDTAWAVSSSRRPSQAAA
jgi:hypothetical protein